MKKQHLTIFLLTAAIILLIGCSRSGSTANNTSDTSASSTSKDIQVSLTDYKISSSTTNFSKGVAYHFVVRNDSNQKHEFMIQPPMTDSSMPMQAMDKMALAHIANIDPGQTQTIDVTFSQVAATGKLELACHLAGHYEAGMHTVLTVA